MNQQTYIQIGDDVLPIRKNDYRIEYTDVETDRITETGTTSREIVREGKLTITTNFVVTQEWIAKLRAYKASPTLTVLYYDPATGAAETATMWVTTYSTSLLQDRVDNPVFSVNMTLEEY